MCQVQDMGIPAETVAVQPVAMETVEVARQAALQAVEAIRSGNTRLQTVAAEARLITLAKGAQVSVTALAVVVPVPVAEEVTVVN